MGLAYQIRLAHFYECGLSHLNKITRTFYSSHQSHKDLQVYKNEQPDNSGTMLT